MSGPDLTPEDLERRATILRQPLGVATCQALGIRYLDTERLVTAEMPWHPRVTSTADPDRVHRGAIATLVDQTVGTGVMIERGRRDAQATISLRIDWLAEAPAGHPVRCVVRHVAMAAGTAFIHADVESVGRPGLIAAAAAQFILGANPGGSADAHLFDAPPPREPTAELRDFDTYLGLEGGGADHVLAPRSRLVGHPLLPAFHGGIVAAALLEAARRTTSDQCGRIVCSNATFLRPALADRALRLSTTIVRNGRSILVARTHAWQKSADEPAAIGEMILRK